MSERNRKNYPGLLIGRMFIAITLNITLQIFLLCLLILITNINTNVKLWLQNTWETIISLKLRIHFFVFVAFLQGIIYCNNYLHRQPYLKNRFLKIQHIFTGQNLLRGLLCILMGCNLVWLHLSLKKGNHNLLIDNCDTLYGSCLIEEHYFLLLGGMWTGFYFFLTTSLSNQRYFQFSIIPMTKFSKFRKGIYSMLSTITSISLWPVIYFIIGYYLLGSYMRDFILSITSAQIETKPLDNFPQLLNVSLTMYLWLYQSTLIFTSNTTILLLEVFLTEWIPLEIQPNNNIFDSHISTITLADVLSMDNIPMIQHLGYLDLVTLAEKQETRRRILFTLSQPGGHPYNWNCIIEKSLNFINKFSDELNAITLKAKEQQFASSTSTITTSISSNLSAFKSEYTYNMRKLVTDTIPSANESCVSKSPEIKSLTYKYIKTKWDLMISYFLSKPLIYYVFGEQDELKIEYALFNAQAVIWAAEAISSLAIVSLKEDSYGIVQKDLPDIFHALLALKLTLDKLYKSNILMKKSQNSDRCIKQMFNSLRSASKRSLYRITTGFENYINDLKLESTMIEHLQPFLNYKE
ncbi:nucleoporin NDC1-like [Vespa mandarinia]|uniref:nucleoporin NDC1-like n=1 Tax=Vespa mandarinia TaxID=7446 RepID=UPI00161CDC19|nr:nucleoporin NDC1-like [Vespa mandarinia]